MFDLPKSNIRLRPFRGDADLEHILEVHNDTRSAPYISENFLVPRGEALEDQFKRQIHGPTCEMFCMIETIPAVPNPDDPTTINAFISAQPVARPVFVGYTAFWINGAPGQRHCSFAITIHPDFWTKGIGSEVMQFMIDHAFVHLRMHRLSLEVFNWNDRAYALYKKCGFVDEGRARKAIWVNGDWRDIVRMGLLVEEWQERRVALGIENVQTTY